MHRARLIFRLFLLLFYLDSTAAVEPTTTTATTEQPEEDMMKVGLGFTSVIEKNVQLGGSGVAKNCKLRTRTLFCS